MAQRLELGANAHVHGLACHRAEWDTLRTLGWLVLLGSGFACRLLRLELRQRQPQAIGVVRLYNVRRYNHLRA